MTERIPFFTGSQVYGVPRPQSNTDIVVWMGDALETYPGVRSIWFNHTRLIFVSLAEEYDAWLAATLRMIEWRNMGHPVPKDVAIAEIDKEHEARGLIALRPNLRVKHGLPPIAQTPID